MAEQNNTLHMGWLTTRNGEKYAPATLIENVFSEDGTSYDETVRGYIQQVKNESTTTLNTLQNKLNTLDSDFDAAVQRLDNKDAAIERKIANFGDDQDSNALYVVDKNNNVIAYVNENGVTSTNFSVPGTTDFKTAAANIGSLQTRMTTAENDIDALERSMDNIGVEDDNAFYIIDKNENVIAYIDATGVHSTNFTIDNSESAYADYLTLINKVEEHISEISGLHSTDNELRTNIATLTNSINERLKNFNGEDDNFFFFIDSKDNVIAYIDVEGIHTTGLNVTEAGINVNARLNIHNNSGSVLAYIDAAGVHAPDVLLEGASIESLKTILYNLEQTDSGLTTQINTVRQNLNDEISNRSIEDGKLQAAIDKTDQRTKYINGEANDCFYIIDKDENVLVYADENGVHSTNFLIDSDTKTLYSVKDTLDELVDQGGRHSELLAELRGDLNLEIQNRINAINNINKRTEHLNGEPSDCFFITDANSNVVAYIDKEGLHTTEVFTEILDGDTLKQRYAVNTIGGDVDALKTWRPNIQGQANSSTNDVTRIFSMLGENREFDIATGADHKSRLDKLDNVLALDSTSATGESARLKRLDDVVGVIDPNNTEDGTHETRLVALRQDVIAEVERSGRIDGLHTEQIQVLQNKTANLDASQNDKFFIIDKNENVVAYFDANGLTVTNILAYGIAYDNTTSRYIQAEDLAGTEYSLSTKLVSILNELLDIQSLNATQNGRLDDAEDRLGVQEAVTGETAVPTKNHKTRLDEIDTELGLNGGVYTRFTAGENRLNSLEGIVGKRADAANSETTATHESRIKANDDRLDALETLLDKQNDGQFAEYERIRDLVGKAADTANASGSHESRIKDVRADLTAVEERLDNVSNVMDFIGSFATYADLQNYAIPNNGDVAVVVDTSTEYVYKDGWIELGNSTATQTAIANLQEIVGEEKLSGTTSHKSRLAKLEQDVGILNSTTGENINYLYSTINYRGRFTTDTIKDMTPAPSLGDLAHINSVLNIYNYKWDSSTSTVICAWEPYGGLSRKLYNIDGSDDNTLYIVDNHDNVLATFGAEGLSTVDLLLKKTNGQFTDKTTMVFMVATGDEYEIEYN